MLKVLDIDCSARAAGQTSRERRRILDTIVLTALHCDGKRLEADVEPRRSSDRARFCVIVSPLRLKQAEPSEGWHLDN